VTASAPRAGVLRHAGSGAVVAPDACLAEGFRALLIGLIGRASVPAGFALGLVGCDQIHTFGVRFSLDVAYCDREGKVLLAIRDLPPNRIAPRARGAAIVWEMPAGTLDGCVQPGESLLWETERKPPRIGA